MPSVEFQLYRSAAAWLCQLLWLNKRVPDVVMDPFRKQRKLQLLIKSSHFVVMVYL